MSSRWQFQCMQYGIVGNYKGNHKGTISTLREGVLTFSVFFEPPTPLRKDIFSTQSKGKFPCHELPPPPLETVLDFLTN